jgi:hypothetical protein
METCLLFILALQFFDSSTSNVPSIIHFFNSVRPQEVVGITLFYMKEQNCYEMFFKDYSCTTMRIYLDPSGVRCVWMEYKRDEWGHDYLIETDHIMMFPYKTTAADVQRDLDRLEELSLDIQTGKFVRQLFIRNNEL